MEKFSINIIDKKPAKINKKTCCLGKIIIGDFVEFFFMSLDTWTDKEYKKQWREGLERIKAHDSSCLIADMTMLKGKPYINLWILYKIDNTIFIQNHILAGKMMKERSKGLPPYNAQTCYLYVPTRQSIGANGNAIFEWKMKADDFFKSVETVFST